jgi:hypothetical protein
VANPVVVMHHADPVTVVHGGPGGGDAEQAQGEDGDSKLFHGTFLKAVNHATAPA